MKVLVIEDDKEIVDAISLAFQIRWPEAKVISTRLGQKGVDLVEGESPDIVILDLVCRTSQVLKYCVKSDVFPPCQPLF